VLPGPVLSLRHRRLLLAQTSLDFQVSKKTRQ
jgi:hypothetical protein